MKQIGGQAGKGKREVNEEYQLGQPTGSSHEAHLEHNEELELEKDISVIPLDSSLSSLSTLTRSRLKTFACCQTGIITWNGWNALLNSYTMFRLYVV